MQGWIQRWKWRGAGGNCCAHGVKLAVRVAHSTVGGSGGHVPPEKIEHLRPLETTVTTQNLA